MTTRVIIVEDEPLFRELLQHTIASELGIDVVGLAEDGETAIALSQKTKPDVVLMDIELKGELDGIETGLEIKKKRPQTGIVILSVHRDRQYLKNLSINDLTGWAYLLKQTVPDLATVGRAIEGTKVGMLVLDPAIFSNMRPKEGSTLLRLTARQREVLEFISQGYNNIAIAQRLGLAEKSVETYINTIYQELHLSKEEGIHARVKATLLYLQEFKRYK